MGIPTMKKKGFGQKVMGAVVGIFGALIGLQMIDTFVGTFNFTSTIAETVKDNIVPMLAITVLGVAAATIYLRRK